MRPQDRDPFVRTVIGFAELRGKTLSAPAIEIYWRAMQDWPIDEFQAAAQHLIRACQFMPTPYDFEQLRKAAKPTAGEAFARAVQHAASSAYRNGELGDAQIDSAVRALGGYVAIAMCDTDKLHFLERRFAEHYEALGDALIVRSELSAIASNDRPKLTRST